MSNPPVQSENAAPIAPVRPSGPAKSPSALDAAPPPPHTVASASPRAPPAHVHGSPVHEEDSPSRSLPLIQDTPSPPSNASQNKWSRGPVPQPRPTGPSLLTQALATARATPHGQAELSQSQPTTPSRSRAGSSSTVAAQNDHDASAYQSDGDTVTPRGSPRAAQTSTRTPTDSPSASTPRQYPRQESSHTPTPKMLDTHQASSMLSAHRDILDRSMGKERSLERMENNSREEEPLMRSQSFGITSEEPAAGSRPQFRKDSAVGQRALTFNAGDAESSTNQPRPHKLEHRVTIGPEKAWSIGIGESRDGRDGQVEKSITEVLAGVEPNARSRKASHSLRFFKEGLPEEKTRRKEPRAGSNHRESPGDKRSATGDEPRDLHAGDGQASPQPREDGRGSKVSNRARTSALQSPKVPPVSESPEDYFILRTDSSTRSAAQPELPFRAKPAEPEIQGCEVEEHALSQDRVPQHDDDARRKSADSTEAGEGTEDADDSSEEKISSAVFVPHQGLDEPSEIASQDTRPSPMLTAGARSVSRSDDFHPWLVKAGEPEDEPEVDDQGVQTHEVKDSAPSSQEMPQPRPPGKAHAHISDAQATLDEPEIPKHALQPSRTFPQYSEEHVHDHQMTPKQPLDAIELIPYKHQVGGHTTLWRFSKRAVCKQLNNRENEFYERIERYHRDLLPFLPRYIGVLNVTFQKRGRRKSTHKQDDGAAQERKQLDQDGASATSRANGGPDQDVSMKAPLELLPAESTHHRVISQSLQSTHIPVPTVTFVDNQHILPRNLLQPTQAGPTFFQHFRSVSGSAHGGGQPINGGNVTPDKRNSPLRPSLEDRHANSWGATTVNKRLRNEVFNDAFLKEPITIQKHRRGHQRAVPRRTIQQTLRPVASASPLMTTQTVTENTEAQLETPGKETHYNWSPVKCDRSPQSTRCSELRHEHVEEVKDVTGTSAPEPEILPATPPQRRKRRHSGSALRRRPKDVKDARGDLIYFEEPDELGFKADSEDNIAQLPREVSPGTVQHPTESTMRNGETAEGTAVSSAITTAANTGPSSPSEEVNKIPRPVNPKEAQTQHDPRVEYFLLLEDLTAGMKRPCIMDLKMGTRQYGVDANPKKQKSQQGKCAKTTSRELGVRVCGLQVWDVQTQSYVFKDKYFGRNLKAGREFQDTLTRFLYDGVDPSSILRHIPTVLQKLSQLETIIRRLRGYRFYAASLLMFYDGDTSSNEYDTSVEDSSTDFATDTEEVHRRPRRNKREIDFKMADFANSVTEGDLAKDRPCPPQHPNEPDRGFLRGLRSLRKYFLKIQQDTRASMGLITRLRNGMPEDIDLEDDDDDDDEGSVSE
ncbi:SAICAR synthase-like protein [Coniochaeta ligniaria NRRL 30616]|uniref:Kinase n=1 Tax=Coniochaeta ligniaria NRRL 30616 TaxID=1408157 RepID=A0A1J7JK17_9PEZI|nr:SAICAR synthase-like protein [Coniochaeta ligniaria NRRL 30616]